MYVVTKQENKKNSEKYGKEIEENGERIQIIDDSHFKEKFTKKWQSNIEQKKCYHTIPTELLEECVTWTISKVYDEMQLPHNKEVMKQTSELEKEIGKYPELNNLMLDCELSIKYTSKIEKTIENVSQFMDNEKITGKVTPELFIDPEFPNWKMLKINIKINADLVDIYEKFKEPIYEIFNSNLPEEVIEKLMIKFERMN